MADGQFSMALLFDFWLFCITFVQLLLYVPKLKVFFVVVVVVVCCNAKQFIEQ